jgi:tryptophan synthase alpha subunit
MFALGVDGVITGSRVIELLQSGNGKSQLKQLEDFCQSMLAVCTRGGAARAKIDAG